MPLKTNSLLKCCSPLAWMEFSASNMQPIQFGRSHSRYGTFIRMRGHQKNSSSLVALFPVCDSIFLKKTYFVSFHAITGGSKPKSFEPYVNSIFDEIEASQKELAHPQLELATCECDHSALIAFSEFMGPATTFNCKGCLNPAVSGAS